MKADNNEEQDQEGEKKEIDIMEKLHKKKMYVIEKCFAKEEKGLEIQQFIKVMLEHLEYNKDSQEEIKKITLALIELFKEIDVNGDGTMEWEEFSNHIIELGLLRNDRSFKNVIKQYYPSDNIKDDQKHETGIEKVYFFDRLKMLMVLEKDSPRFKVYNSSNSELIWNVNAHKGSVLSAEYIPDQNLIATSSNDLTINFWDSSSFNLKQILSVPEIQLCMRYAKWSSTHQSLIYTGGSDSIIHIYDTQYLKEKGTLSGWNPFFKKDTQQYGHASPIGDILPIDSQSTLVTAGLDGNICLWDITTHAPKKELRGHEKGVYSLDWSDWSPMNQCLISAGLDHEAFVWNTYVKEKIFLLRGHNHPLVAVKCLPRTPQVITADISGMVKVWDVRNFICMQTFNVPTDEVSSFTLTYPKKQIVVGARKLYYYEYDEPKDQLLTDERMCLKVLYNSTLLCFITLHPDSIKIWDARSGKLQSVYRELSTGELTTVILDKRERKVFVGDSEGRIFTVNIKNGAKMKKFEKHSKMVTDLAHWTSESLHSTESINDQRRVVSVSREETVNIHDEDSQDPHKSCRYKMKQHRGSVNCLSIREGTELLVSCADDGSLFQTNLISYRQELIFKAQHQVEMKKVMYLDPHHCLVATDSIGNIYFIGVLQSKFKNKVLLQKVYKTTSLTNKEETFPVMAMNFCTEDKYLFLADEMGNIKIWDLSFFLQKVDAFKQEEKKPKIKQRRQDQEEQKEQTEEPNFMLTAPQVEGTRPKKKSEVYFDEEPSQVFQTNKNQLNLEKIFFQDDIQEAGFYRKAHLDGITFLEICKERYFFATSSFDCCCYIWSYRNSSTLLFDTGDEVRRQFMFFFTFLKNQKRFKQEIYKVGSLILGHDKNWGFVIDEETRREEALVEVEEILEEVRNLKSDDDEEEEEEQKKQPAKVGSGNSNQKLLDMINERAFSKKSKQPDSRNTGSIAFNIQEEDNSNLDKRLKAARKALNYHDAYQKRVKQKNLSQYDAEDLVEPVNFVEGFTKDVYQQDDFDDDDEEDYNILSDLQDYKNQQLNAGAFTSKNAFKTKLIKGHNKIKFK